MSITRNVTVPYPIMPAAKITSTRKRNRKRKRRAAFSSSSSESSDTSSSEAEDQQSVPKTSKIAISSAKSSSSPSSSDSSLSNSDSESNSGADEEPPATSRPATQKHSSQGELRALTPTRQNVRATRASPSPSPPPATLPSFLPSTDEDATKSQEMRDKLRKFWMASVAEGFKDDLEQIRKVGVRERPRFR